MQPKQLQTLCMRVRVLVTEEPTVSASDRVTLILPKHNSTKTITDCGPQLWPATLLYFSYETLSLWATSKENWC